MWQNARIKIMAGVGYYPACVKDWDAVKELEKLSILSIGEETDVIADDAMRTVAEALETKLATADKRYKAQLQASVVDPNADIVEKKKNAIKKNTGLLKAQTKEEIVDGMISAEDGE